MPGDVDGLGLVAHVEDTYREIPVVLTSGGMARHELERPGVSAVVPKPYSEEDLSQMLRQVLRISDA